MTNKKREARSRFAVWVLAVAALADSAGRIEGYVGASGLWYRVLTVGLFALWVWGAVAAWFVIFGDRRG